MEAFRNPDGSFTTALLLGAAMLIVCLFLVSRMKDVKVNAMPKPEGEAEPKAKADANAA
jgi:hypothetical protein